MARTQNHSPRSIEKLLAPAALVIAVAILCGGFVSARMYYLAGGSPADVVALRYGVAAAVTLPFLLMNLGLLTRQPGIWRCIGLAVLGGAPFGFLVLTGVAGAPVVHGAGIVPGVALMSGTLLSYFLLGERLTSIRVFGLVVALLGLIVLVLPEIRSGEARWWGDCAYFGAGTLWGGFTVALRAWQIKPLQGATLAAVFSLPYLAIYIVYLDPTILDVATIHTVVHGIYQGIVFNVIAVMMYGWGIGRLGATAAVATMPLMPVYGTLMEWSILGRTPHFWVIGAIALISLGVLMALGILDRRTAK